MVKLSLRKFLVILHDQNPALLQPVTDFSVALTLRFKLCVAPLEGDHECGALIGVVVARDMRILFQAHHLVDEMRVHVLTLMQWVKNLQMVRSI